MYVDWVAARYLTLIKALGRGKGTCEHLTAESDIQIHSKSACFFELYENANILRLTVGAIKAFLKNFQLISSSLILVFIYRNPSEIYCLGSLKEKMISETQRILSMHR